MNPQESKSKQSVEQHEAEADLDFWPKTKMYVLKCFDCDYWSFFHVEDEDLKTTRASCPHCGGDFSYKSKDSCK